MKLGSLGVWTSLEGMAIPEAIEAAQRIEARVVAGRLPALAGKPGGLFFGDLARRGVDDRAALPRPGPRQRLRKHGIHQSIAVTAAGAGTSSQSAATSDGTPLSSGASRSETLTT